MLSVCSVLQLLLCEECPASLAVLSCTCAMKETAILPALFAAPVRCTGLILDSMKSSSATCSSGLFLTAGVRGHNMTCVYRLAVCPWR